MSTSIFLLPHTPFDVFKVLEKKNGCYLLHEISSNSLTKMTPNSKLQWSDSSKMQLVKSGHLSSGLFSGPQKVEVAGNQVLFRPFG